MVQDKDKLRCTNYRIFAMILSKVLQNPVDG